LSIDVPLVLPAWAKVNLTLEVLGHRPDGYHEIASVMQTVELHDHLTIAPGDTITLHCDLPELSTPDNLVLRAVRALRAARGVTAGAAITLDKGIPVAAGLGGGSSDAATALRALSRLWRISLSGDELDALAARLGSDVPFFLRGGTALVEGRGERVTSLPPLPTHWVVLVTPPLQIPDKTARLYAQLTPADYTKGEATVALARHTNHQLSPTELFNVFQPVAERLFPAIKDWKERMLQAGAPSVHLAGSGPTLFCLFAEEAAASQLCQRLERGGAAVYLTRTIVPPGP
jgi:4-diphosphocytidyl-2-C-methyl-D-erythritol kinase